MKTRTNEDKTAVWALLFLFGGMLLGVLIFGYHCRYEKRVTSPYKENGDLKPGYGAWV